MDDEKGLTLIELVVAMLILVMLSLTYATYTTTSFSSYYIAGKDTVAVNYARQKLEEIKALPEYPGPTLTGNITPEYTYKVELSNYESIPKLYKATSTVFYSTKAGNQKNVSFTTLVYFWGVN